eukprot:scaffold2911_cov414-Prasinococcus_capsulatus_cf.AAC.8
MSSECWPIVSSRGRVRKISWGSGKDDVGTEERRDLPVANLDTVEEFVIYKRQYLSQGAIVRLNRRNQRR